MTNRQRMELIERFIRENRYADLHTLSERFAISVSTVRRALNDLEQRGVVRRHHGGASLVEEDVASGGYDFITQDVREAQEKEAIGRAIAERIDNGMTVILDGGTTTYAVARMLLAKRLIIVTNSLPIAALFGDVGTCETIVTGGTVYSRLGVLYGPTCELSLSQVHADVAVLGGAGITAEGVWNTNSFIVSVQKHMLGASDRVFFALDHTKFGRRALHLATRFQRELAIVTDRPPEASIARAVAHSGASVVVVPSAGRASSRS